VQNKLSREKRELPRRPKQNEGGKAIEIDGKKLR